MNYFKREKDKIVCQLCRHYCKLKENQIGICGVNKNEKGKLSNLVYTHPQAINVDPIEKKPLYHFLPSTLAFSIGTVGCNFRCPFCQNWTISQTNNIDKNIEISPKQIVKLAKKYNCHSIAYTYNEPTIFYPYAKDIGIIAKKEGIKNIFVSNGFESPEVIRDIKNWLDGANLDLKSWSNSYYKKVLKGGLEEIKDTIKMMIDEGIWIEITTLLIEGENDKDEELEEMASFIANKLGKYVPWHLSAFHPDYKMQDRKRTDFATLKRAYDIAKNAGLYYVYLGNVALSQETFCPNCKELLIKRDGYKTAIFSLKNGKCQKCGERIEGVWI